MKRVTIKNVLKRPKKEAVGKYQNYCEPCDKGFKHEKDLQNHLQNSAVHKQKESDKSEADSEGKDEGRSKAQTSRQKAMGTGKDRKDRSDAID